MQEYLLCQAEEEAEWKSPFCVSNAYGPEQSLGNPYTSVLSIFAWQLIARVQLSIFEGGEIVRDSVL